MHTIITHDKRVVRGCATWREASWTLDRIIAHKVPPQLERVDGDLAVIEGDNPESGKVVELYTKLV